MSDEQGFVDSRRIAAEEVQDAKVMTELRKAGDIPEVSRPISVYFVGTKSNIARLERDAEKLGWRLISVSKPDKDGFVYLSLERSQAVTSSEVARLRDDALKLEALYRVNYDGWEAPIENTRS